MEKVKEYNNHEVYISLNQQDQGAVDYYLTTPNAGFDAAIIHYEAACNIVEDGSGLSKMAIRDFKVEFLIPKLQEDIMRTQEFRDRQVLDETMENIVDGSSPHEA